MVDNVDDVTVVSAQVEPSEDVCQMIVPVFPVKLIEALEPEQIVDEVALAVPPTLGIGFTVTEAYPVSLQPFPSVPITE